ncbi:YtxH domain-containing protein [bacterium]|nr:YtxH domain-containing protein [bacterium]
MCKKNESLCFGLGLMAGVVGGVIAAVLYAPKSGEESRKEVKEAIENFVETQAPSIQEAKKQASETLDMFKYKVEQYFQKLNNSLKNRKMKKAKELEDLNYDFSM